MHTALLLIDIQNDYFPGGRMELEGSDAAADAAALLLQIFRKKSLPVVHIQHVSTRPGSTFFLPDTEGVKIHARVAPLQGDAPAVLAQADAALYQAKNTGRNKVVLAQAPHAAPEKNTPNSALRPQKQCTIR